jgi:hypothetical protein
VVEGIEREGRGLFLRSGRGVGWEIITVRGFREPFAISDRLSGLRGPENRYGCVRPGGWIWYWEGWQWGSMVVVFVKMLGLEVFWDEAGKEDGSVNVVRYFEGGNVKVEDEVSDRGKVHRRGGWRW